MTDEQMSDICMECRACCRYIGFVAQSRTDFPDGKSDVSDPSANLIEFMKVWGYEMRPISDNEYAAILHNPCQHIRDWGCDIYETRPQFCRDYFAFDDPALRHLCKLPSKERK